MVRIIVIRECKPFLRCHIFGSSNISLEGEQLSWDSSPKIVILYKSAQGQITHPQESGNAPHQQEHQRNYRSNQEYPFPVHHVKLLFSLPGAQFLGLKNVLAPHICKDIQKFQICHTNPSFTSCVCNRFRRRNSIDFTLLTLKPDFSAISSVESRYQ